MIAIIDYKAGNQTSVLRALEFLNIEACITDDDDTIMKAHGVIFPGVGAAKQAMDRLMQNKQDELLKALVAESKPLLGICLGCQILLEHSEENNTETLGIIKGSCKKFDENWTDGTDENNNPEKIRIPHMGWNSISIKKENPILKNIRSNDTVYYVHSYYPEPADTNLVLATSTYGKEFAAVYGRNGLWAIQFHPEKSGGTGLQILKNFNEYCMQPYTL